eukprot:scaffold205227_cov29-Tisochrysis_lutea.AAC.5
MEPPMEPLHGAAPAEEAQAQLSTIVCICTRSFMHPSPPRHSLPPLPSPPPVVGTPSCRASCVPHPRWREANLLSTLRS